MPGWIGVDLDGTLAEYHGWINELHIGEPVPEMVERVKRWLDEGHEVRIFTARVSVDDERMRAQIVDLIQRWAYRHTGYLLVVTNEKDFGMIELWDDRAVQVVPNTGKPVGTSTRGLS